jgi:hypothetical protein
MKNTTYKGKYESIRRVYFKERSPERIREIQELQNDVEYLIAEIRRMERRACAPSLVSLQLRNLAMQLEYWEEKRTYHYSDYKMMQILSDRWYVHSIVPRMVVFDSSVIGSWFWEETEGGHENDIFIPFKDTLTKKQHITFQGRSPLYCSRKDILLMLSNVTHRRIEESND